MTPEYCLFAPGACYIVLKEQVLLHSKAFYQNLNKIITYGLNPSFPSEAHQIERLLPIIFSANYIENEWMNDLEQFDIKIDKEREITEKSELNRNKENNLKSKFRKKFFENK